MPISKYNLLQFVLQSFDDRTRLQETCNWNEWLASVSRIYDHNIPEAVLSAILRLNNHRVKEVDEFCSAKLEAIHHKLQVKQEQHSKHAQKIQDWISRRDAGNKRTKAKQERQNALLMAAQKQKDAEVTDLHIKEMLPKWREQIEQVQQQRNELASHVWNAL